MGESFLGMRKPAERGLGRSQRRDHYKYKVVEGDLTLLLACELSPP